MDFLIRDVGVDFLGEVVVFAVHLGSQVVDPGIYIRIDFAEPLIHVGAKVVYTLVKIADSIVHIAEALIHVGAKIAYSLVKAVYPLVKTVYPLVKTV